MWMIVIGGTVVAGLVALWVWLVAQDGRQVQQRQREHAARRRAGEIVGPESRTNPDLLPPHSGGGPVL